MNADEQRNEYDDLLEELAAGQAPIATLLTVDTLDALLARARARHPAASILE